MFYHVKIACYQHVILTESRSQVIKVIEGFSRVDQRVIPILNKNNNNKMSIFLSP